MATVVVVADTQLFIIDGTVKRPLRTDTVISELESATAGVDRLELSDLTGGGTKLARVVQALMKAGFKATGSCDSCYRFERG